MARVLKDWLTSFEEYCKEMEAPRDWIRWSGISTLSSSIKRNCYTWYRGIQFYPNQYVILVGPPGIGKGECMRKGYELAEAAKSINYIKDWHTPQEILEELAAGFAQLQLNIGQVVTTNITQDHTCTIVAPELAVFLQNYDNLHSLLCAWWDQNKFEYKTKNKGKHVIEDMSVSLLGGCVPDYVRSLSKDRLAPITGGFTARTMFIYATEKFQLVKENFGAPSPQISKLKDDLINDLKHINSLTGELLFNVQAKKLWSDIYEEHNKRGVIDSTACENFKSRISSHIVKTAISISLSESDSKIITRDQLERAVKYVEGVRDQVDIVFRSVGESPISNAGAKLQTYIDTVGSASYKQLLKFMYRDVTEEQLTAILKVYTQIGLIKETVSINNVVMYESTNTFNVNPNSNPNVQGAGNP